MNAPLPSEQPNTGVDARAPHSARVWNYWLGGKDNYAVDRQLGDRVAEAWPTVVDHARASRLFLVRAVRYLVHEAGIRQFLDLGTGLPTADNTHEIAQRLAPDSRVLYVDNDPLVLTHARALLTSSPEGCTDYLDADLREPETILSHARNTLDFAQPMGLLLLSTLGHLGTAEMAHALVRRLIKAAPSGSYLVIHEGILTENTTEGVRRYNTSGTETYHLRQPDEVAAWFDQVELVPPGLVPSPQWRPDLDRTDLPSDLATRAGIGRKP